MNQPDWWRQALRLAIALGAPGLIIGVLSLLSFGFSLVVLLDEYHNPTQTGRSALHRVFEDWVRVDDYLGYTLVDRVQQWELATGDARDRAKSLIRREVTDLGHALTRDDARFRMIRLERLDLGPHDQPALATWQADRSSPAETGAGELITDRVTVTTGHRSDRPSVELAIVYRVIGPVAGAMASVESSFQRLVLALLGLSGYSLLCLGYMARHAQIQRERIAREATAAATLDLADRTCHELGNVAFVVANERRNLAGHIDLLERFVNEDSEVLAHAIKAAGIGPEAAQRLEHALRREYADRGIDPEFELKGSAAIARDVCNQIATCSDYIALTVRELDGHLKRTTLPTALESVALDEIVADALALLAPRIESSTACVDVADWPSMALTVRADRRHLIHAIVNLIKNALEATESDQPDSPCVQLSAAVRHPTAWLTIEDDGPGIEPARLKKIFDAGYSTKATGRGLGLAIVRESIAAQGGVVEVTSRLGKGTTFRIGLPLVHRES